MRYHPWSWFLSLALCLCLWRCEPVATATCKRDGDCAAAQRCQESRCIATSEITSDASASDTSPSDTSASDMASPATDVRCEIICCDGKRQTSPLSFRECSEQNTELAKLCVGSPISAIRLNGLERWNGGKMNCAKECKANCCAVTCCNGVNYTLQAPMANCQERDPAVVALCKDDFGPLHLDYDNKLVWRGEQANCQGRCIYTCCGGEVRSTPTTASGCHLAAVMGNCPKGGVTRIEFNGDLRWPSPQEPAPVCVGSCQIKCCNDERFSEELTAEECQPNHPKVLSRCEGPRLGVASMTRANEATPFWERTTPCQSNCAIQCCDLYAETKIVQHGSCNKDAVEVIAVCSRDERGGILSIAENGVERWNQADLCKTECPVDGTPCTGNPKNTCADYKCLAGKCTPSPINEGKSCGAVMTLCAKFICRSGACKQENFKDGTLCNPAGAAQKGRCCGGSCADVTRDPNHCGRCGARCAPGYKCNPNQDSGNCGCDIDKKVRCTVGVCFGKTIQRCYCNQDYPCGPGQTCATKDNLNYCKYP